MVGQQYIFTPSSPYLIQPSSYWENSFDIPISVVPRIWPWICGRKLSTWFRNKTSADEKIQMDAWLYMLLSLCLYMFFRSSGFFWSLVLLCLSGLGPPVKYFTDRFKAVLLLWIFNVFSVLCLLCLCVRLFNCMWAPAGKRADLLALVCCV